MQISIAKHDDVNQDHSGMAILQHDLQQLEHRISSLSRHRFLTYGVTALSIASSLVFFLLALSDTLPGPLRHVITHVTGHSGFFSGQLPWLLSVTVLLVVLGMGVARSSPALMVMGVGMSTMLYFGTQIIGAVITPTNQPSSCSASARTLGCVLQGTKGHPYPAEYVQAQRVAFAIDHHKPVTAVQRAELGRDLAWISAHFSSISNHQLYQIDVAAYGHPTFPRAQAYAQSIVWAKAASEATYEDSLGAAGALFGTGLLLDTFLLTMKRNRKRFISRVGKLGDFVSHA